MADNQHWCTNLARFRYHTLFSFLLFLLLIPSQTKTLASSLHPVSSCDGCPIGRHQQLGGTICVDCVAGKFANVSGLTSCFDCQPGRFSQSDAAETCDYCMPNYYQPNISATFCAPCPAGNESLSIQSSSCTPCRLGDTSSSGSPCKTCEINKYTPSSGSPCLKCDGEGQGGLQCVNGIASVAENWWPYLQYDDSQNATVFLTTQCPPSYCPGTLLQPFGGPGLNISMPIQYCQYPRLNSAENWLCAECVEKHIAWGAACEPCTQVNFALVTGVVFIAVILVCFLLRASAAAGPLTVLVFFVQIAALELGPVTKWIDWIQFANLSASSTRSCLAPISPIEQKILTLFTPAILFGILACVAGVHKILSIYLRPLSSTTQHRRMSPYWLFSRVYSLFYSLSRDFKVDRYIGTMMAILIFCYTSITATVVQTFHCTAVAPGVSRVWTIPAIDCESDSYRNHLLPLTYIIFIIYIFSFPLGMYFFLRHSRYLITHIGYTSIMQAESPLSPVYVQRTSSTSPGPPSSNSRGSSASNSVNSSSNRLTTMMDEFKSPDSPSPQSSLAFNPLDHDHSSTSPASVERFEFRWSHLYRPYRHRTWYWQPIAMTRRFIFASISVIVVESSVSRYVMYSTFGLLSLMLHLWIRPYRSDQLNQIESLSYVLLICVSFVLTSQTPPYTILTQVVLFFLVVPFSLALCIWTARTSWKTIRVKFRRFAETERREEKEQTSPATRGGGPPSLTSPTPAHPKATIIDFPDASFSYASDVSSASASASASASSASVAQLTQPFLQRNTSIQ